MRRRLFYKVIIVLILAIFMVAFSSMQQVKDLNRKRVKAQLVSTAKLITKLPLEGMQTSDYENIHRDLYEAAKLDLRLSVINPQGDVVYDSARDVSELDNHLAREEVQQVLKGGKAVLTVRHSNSLNRDYIYYAAASEDKSLIVRLALPLDVEQAEILQYRRRVLLISIFSASLLLFALAYGLRKIITPIEKLTESTRDFATGNLAVRIDDQSSDQEVRDLLKAFNQMAALIEFSHEELRQSKLWFEAIIDSVQEPLLVVNRERNLLFVNSYAKKIFDRQIDPSKQTYPLALVTHEKKIDEIVVDVLKKQDSRRAEFNLITREGHKCYSLLFSPISESALVVLFNDITLEYEARNLRSEFVANVSHELKTPLTSIKGYTETLKQNPTLSTREQEVFLDIISNESERLERLINELLNLAKIEQVENDENLSVFDLADLFDEVLVQLDETAQKSQLHLVPAYSGKTLKIRANRDRIKQVVINLLDNALKYSLSGGNIYLDANLSRSTLVKNDNSSEQGRLKDLNNGSVEIRVLDEGIGIKEHEITRIFERFYRTDEGRKMVHDSTGLGLAIVKHIAMLYDGDVECKSEPGKFTEFIVRLNNV